MGEHRLMPGKMTAFDTDIHVPLVVTGPGVAHGRTLDNLVENIDLCPTFAEPAGVAVPATAEATRWCRCCGRTNPAVAQPGAGRAPWATRSRGG